MTIRMQFIAGALVAGGLVGCSGFDDAVDDASAVSASGAAMEHEMELPPGWTEADMQACMAAATLGEMHQFLAQSAGTWDGECTTWMGPGAAPTKNVCTSTVSMMMDGRFQRSEIEGEMPGMGPFHGFGINGFDNVSQQFVSVWMDNCGTGIMHGTGVLSPDHKTLTWNYTYNCPLRNQPAMMREIQRFTGPDAWELEAHGTDPKTGQEFKCMHIRFTRRN